MTDQIINETLLFKYGSGVGTNWSNIRAKNELLSGGGKSSGLLSFLKVSDRNAGAIKSGGTTRRAAKMNVLDIDHPEILDFINWKSIEEDKVVALGKMGYDTSIDGEAYETVSGQNSNNSVRIQDSFMKLIKDEDSLWNLNGRVDKSVNSKVKVSKIWEDICHATWKCGDPGVQFDDTINQWHTCPYGEDGVFDAKYNRINSSNPCSEYMFLDDTACNLASINVLKFYDVEKEDFDLDAYVHTIKIIQLVLESTIHFGQFPTKDIARKSHLFRSTGLGLTNIGMLFLQMALPYDSEQARTIAATLTSIMTGYSYYVSALIAQKIGPFPAYNTNCEAMLNVIKNHARVANYSNQDKEFEGLTYKPWVIDHNILIKIDQKVLSDALCEIWKNTIEMGQKFGFRNAQVTVLAPTGTIAFAMDCATTSSEPFFSHIVYKKLVGGGFMEIINPGINNALRKLGYPEVQIKDILEYVLKKNQNTGAIDGKIEGAPHLKKGHYEIFDTANKCGTGKRFISPEGHIKMMAALTPNVTGAISKTVNLPRDASIEDVKNIYYLSWSLGVKAIALYRDGCKASQPLNSTNSINQNTELTDMTYSQLIELIKNNKNVHKPLRVKPSGIRKAHVHEACINGIKLYITTSFYDDGRLGEIYVSSGRQGSLTKGLLDSISTTISEMLQYGVSAEDISRMYRGQKYEPSGYVTGHPNIKFVDSISDLISKIIDIELGNYTYCQIKDEFVENIKIDKNKNNNNNNFVETLYGYICPNCKSTKMVKNGTCRICTECGSSTGCS